MSTPAAATAMATIPMDADCMAMMANKVAVDLKLEGNGGEVTAITKQ